MIDHPYIADPEFSTTVVSWHDGGLHFFRAVPADGIAFFNVFQLAYGAIFAIALALAYRWWRQGTFRVERRHVLDSALIAVIGVVVGGRLGEAIFYHPGYYFSEPLRLTTNASGFTVHGMIAGVMILYWFWARRIGRPWFHLLDQTVIVVAFGTILGRVANFLAGDLWGRESSVPWAVRFPMRGPLFREVVADPQGTTYMVVQGADGPYLEPWTPDQGFELLDSAEFFSYPVGAPDSTLFELAQMVVTTPRHPSQLYQALAEGLVLLVILLLVRRRAVYVGQLSAWFLVCYGGLRMFTELFRQPEPGLGFLLGLTRGQLLSLSMIVGGGIVFSWVCRRRHLIAELPLSKEQPGDTPLNQPAEPDEDKSVSHRKG